MIDMFKKSTILFVLLVSLIIPLHANNVCKHMLDSALNYFYSGEYYDAKLLFTEISDNCGKNYENVDVLLQLSTHKLKEVDVILYVDGSKKNIVRELTSEKNNISFQITCRGEYYIKQLPKWCEIIKKERDYFTIQYEANVVDTMRCGKFLVKGGGKTIIVRLEQAGLDYPIDTDVIIDSTVITYDNQNTSIDVESLVVSHTSIDAQSSGEIEYIEVSCSREWEIQHTSGSMYSAKRIGDFVQVDILPNQTGVNRSDYFYIRTIDNTESVKITLFQKPNTPSEDSTTF